MHGSRKTEPHSCNPYSCSRAIIIMCSECVCLALVIQYVHGPCSHPWLVRVLQTFSHYLINGTTYEKINL